MLWSSHRRPHDPTPGLITESQGPLLLAWWHCARSQRDPPPRDEFTPGDGQRCAGNVLELSTVAGAETDPLALPQRTLPTDEAGNPNPSAQRNFTDPDSHILKGSDGWMQGYSTQAAVDGDHQVIVAIGVSNQAS